MDIVVASATKPRNVEAFITEIRKVIPECTAMVISNGPGCANYGFRLNLDDEAATHVANQLTMALMPAKWSQCNGDPMLIDDTFYDAREVTDEEFHNAKEVSSET